jgi:hypothetical protein
MFDRRQNSELDESDAGWASLSSHIDAFVQEDSNTSVSDVEVRRLVARVRSATAEPQRRWGWRLTELATLAASGIAAVVVLVTADGTREPRVRAGLDPAAGPVSQVERADDGAVVIKFADSQKTHRIRQSERPAPGGAAEIHVAKGGRFVDRNQELRPGTVTFYRID